MQVVALPGGLRFAMALARALHCDCTPLAVHRFPDGEILVRIDADVRGDGVVFAGSLDHPDEKALPLLFAADAARELGAARIGLAAPYLAYLRQDARFHPGEAISARSFARLLSGAVDFLVTAEPHLHRIAALDEVFTIPAMAVPAAEPIAAWLRSQVANPVIVGPDAESEAWTARLAALCDAPHFVMAKTRRGDRDVAVTLPDLAAFQGRTPVLVDDIVSTGRTMAQAARALASAGMPAALAVAVHALFGPGEAEELQRAGVAAIASCDTVEHPSNAISLVEPIAHGVARLAAGASR